MCGLIIWKQHPASKSKRHGRMRHKTRVLPAATDAAAQPWKSRKEP